VDGTLAMMAQWSLRELARRCRHPRADTVPAWRNDQAVRAVSGRTRRGAMPDARLRPFDNVGHLAQEEAPDRVAAEVAHVSRRHAARRRPNSQQKGGRRRPPFDS
jgi:magnesium chelatase accessory protein